MSEDLKKYCLERAMEAVSGHDITRVAREFYVFLTESEETKAPAQEDAGPRKVVIKAFVPRILNGEQKAILRLAIKWHDEDKKISGSALADALNRSQSHVSKHLRFLVQHGYMRRQGNKFWPVRKPDGSELPVQIKIMPPGHAKGYKPMTAKLGDVGRIK